jgi:hypothetical protein
MTAVYRAIEQNLWKKDAVKLEKRTPPQMLVARQREISNSVKDELHLLEFLAFTGMHNVVIDFSPTHREAISEKFNPVKTNLLLDKMLARLSFLRTSDPSSQSGDKALAYKRRTRVLPPLKLFPPCKRPQLSS